MIKIEIEYLSHHNIKDQNCGIRRYQNPDGSLTESGKQRSIYQMRAISAARTSKDVNDIIGSLNTKDQDGILAGSDRYLNFEEGSTVVKRILKKIGDTPVAFFDILEDGDTLQVVLGTNNDYRGKGYGSEVARKGMKWIDDNIWDLNRMQKSADEVEVTMGDQCHNPYDCWYCDYCKSIR